MPTLDVDGVYFDLTYDEAIKHAKGFVPDHVRVDMCRREGVPATFWLFIGDKQIGAVAEEGGELWRASMLIGGMPTAMQYFDTLELALKFAAN